MTNQISFIALFRDTILNEIEQVYINFFNTVARFKGLNVLSICFFHTLTYF